MDVTTFIIANRTFKQCRLQYITNRCLISNSRYRYDVLDLYSIVNTE